MVGLLNSIRTNLILKKTLGTIGNYQRSNVVFEKEVISSEIIFEFDIETSELDFEVPKSSI